MWTSLQRAQLGVRLPVISVRFLQDQLLYRTLYERRHLFSYRIQLMYHNTILASYAHKIYYRRYNTQQLTIMCEFATQC